MAEPVEFPVPYCTDYVLYDPTRRDHLDYIKRAVESHDPNPKLAGLVLGALVGAALGKGTGPWRAGSSARSSLEIEVCGRGQSCVPIPRVRWSFNCTPPWPSSPVPPVANLWLFLNRGRVMPHADRPSGGMGLAAPGPPPAALSPAGAVILKPLLLRGCFAPRLPPAIPW